jgi:hypothetical protein
MCVLQGWAFYWGTSEWSREQLEEVRAGGDQLEYEALRESHCWTVLVQSFRCLQCCAAVLMC